MYPGGARYESALDLVSPRSVKYFWLEMVPRKPVYGEFETAGRGRSGFIHWGVYHTKQNYNPPLPTPASNTGAKIMGPNISAKLKGAGVSLVPCLYDFYTYICCLSLGNFNGFTTGYWSESSAMLPMERQLSAMLVVVSIKWAALGPRWASNCEQEEK